MKPTNHYRIIERMGSFICQRKYVGKLLWRGVEEWEDMKYTVSGPDYYWHGAEFTTLEKAEEWLRVHIELEKKEEKDAREYAERQAKLRARGPILIKEIDG